MLLIRGEQPDHKDAYLFQLGPFLAIDGRDLVGGLLTTTADPMGIFVFRNGTRKISNRVPAAQI